MYASQKVDTNEYLLGKRIDKNVEVMKEDEKQTLVQGAVSGPSTSLPTAGDILAKVKEDPLFLIKKKEEDNRKTLLENPMKLRKMRELLKEKMIKEQHDKTKKRKKNEDQAPEELEKYKKQFKEGSRKEKYADTSKQQKEKRNYHDNESDTLIHRFSRKRYSSSEQKNDNKQERKKYKTERNYENRNTTNNSRRNRNSSSSPEYNKNEDKQRTEGPIHKKTEKNRRADRTKDKSMKRAVRSNDEDDEDDMEAKRKAMMENAKWRHAQRIENVKRYKIEDKKEEELTKAALKNTNVVEEKARFIRKMETASYLENNISVEERIRCTIHSKQRTNAELNKKFTSR